jgi:hypothetical protein
MTKKEKAALKDLAVISRKLVSDFDWDSIFQTDSDGMFVQNAIAFQSWLIHLNFCIQKSNERECITFNDI